MSSCLRGKRSPLASSSADDEPAPIKGILKDTSVGGGDGHAHFHHAHQQQKSGGSPSPSKAAAAEDSLDLIQTLSLEEVAVADSPPEEKPKHHKKGRRFDSLSGCRGSSKKKSPPSAPSGPAGSAGGALFQPAGADGSMVRSGHHEYNTLYASNDVVTGPITVNVCNAPNNSTLQCGCENISCPFCNLMLSIEKTDPTVLQ